MLSCVFGLASGGCRRNTMSEAIDTGYLYSAETAGDIARIRHGLAKDVKKADVLVICDHKTRLRFTRCSIRTILPRDTNIDSLGMKEGDSIKRHRTRIRSDEAPEGMVSLYAANGEWIESSAIYAGKIKRMVRSSDGNYLGYEFSVDQVTEMFKAANQPTEVVRQAGICEFEP